MSEASGMEPDQVAHMAHDFAAWVRQTVERLRAGVGFDEGGMPYLDPAATRALQEAVSELSPDAARFALVAALIALVGTDT